MATSIADNTKTEEWLEPRATPRRDPMFTGAEVLWTVVGVALLGAFLLFVVDDFPLRALISVQ
jgi:hypothetical protein